MQSEDGLNSDQPGAIPLRTLNVAPLAGHRLVGYVPYGLTRVSAPNMGGKSRLLSALLSIGLRTLRPGDVSITRGHREAELSFGVAEIRLLEDAKVQRSTPNAEGPIGRLPDPIELMISGDDLVDQEARWRRRVTALNAFVPVEATPTRLRRLAGVNAPVQGGQTLAEWLLERHDRKAYPSLLQAAEELAGRAGELNKRALACEQVTARSEADVQRGDGRIDGICRDLGGKLGFETFDDWAAAAVRRLLEEMTLDRHERAPARLRKEEIELARQRASLVAREAEEARRTVLREAHGEEPSSEVEEAAAQRAQTDLSAAESRLDFENAKVSEKDGAIAELEKGLPEIRDALKLAARTWTMRVGDATNLATVDEWPRTDARNAVDRAQVAELAFRSALGVVEVSQGRLEALRKDRGYAVEAQQDAERDRDAAKKTADKAELEATQARERWTSWHQTSALLEAALEGSTAKEVAEQEVRVAEAKKEADVAASWLIWVGASDLASVVRNQHSEAAADGKILRREVELVWRRLGEILTEALNSDLVRVRDLRVEVRNDDGRWLDVDNDVELSKGRLRRVFLDFWLERVEEGSNFVVPEEIVLLIDGTGRRELSARAAARRVRLLFEQPAEDGADAAPVLFWYGADPLPAAAGGGA